MTTDQVSKTSFQPLRHDFDVVYGDTWPLRFTLGTEDADGSFKPDNLAGASARFQVCDEEREVSLMTVAATITPLAGLVDASRPYSDTRVAWDSGVYELELTYSDGTRRTEVAGKITVIGGRVADD